MNRLKKWIILALPGFFGFFIVYILPFFESIVYSFQKNIFTKEFVWLDNYKTVLSNAYFQQAARNTLVFLVAGCILVIIVSVAVSYLLLVFFNNNSFIKGIILIPFFIPSAAVVSAFKYVFDPVFFSYKIPETGPGLFMAQIPILTIFIWKNCGLMIIIVNTAMQRISSSVLEASKLDGAGVFKRLTKMIIPLVRPNLLFVLVLTVSESLGIYKESFLFYNTDYPPKGAYFLQNYMNNHYGKMNYEILTATTVIFVIIVGIVVSLFYLRERRTSEEIC